MKKLLLTLLITLVLGGAGYAKVIEFEKCFNTQGMWEYKEDGSVKRLLPNEVVWTEENFIRATSYIEVKKKDLIKNSEFLPISKKGLEREVKKYPNLDIITFKAKNFSMDEINLFMSIGGELKPYFEKNVYSLNTENGIMTQMTIETRDWFNYTILRTEEDINGNSNKIVNDKKGLQNILNYIKKKGRVDIKKFNVTTYAGDTLIVKNDKSENIFDLEKGTITKRFVSSGSVNTFSSESFYKCPNGIKSQTEDENNGSSGTAFFVSNKGHLLTNNHVVDGCEISKITYQDKDYDTQLLATDTTLDLALLKADLRNKSYLNFSGDEAKKMQKIYVGGYPLGKGLSDDLKISSGIVSSLKGFEDNSNEIQIDAAINPGNSGGPIINEDGELVAIAVSGMSKDTTEGINFGIKASAAERFLKSNNLKASSSFFSSSKDNDELLEILEEATVYTYCN